MRHQQFLDVLKTQKSTQSHFRTLRGWNIECWINVTPNYTPLNQSGQYRCNRPISVTPVLSRLVERRIVRRYIYPALNTPPRVLTLQTNMPLGQQDRLQLPLLLSIILFVLCCLVTSMFEFLYLTFQKRLTV